GTQLGAGARRYSAVTRADAARRRRPGSFGPSTRTEGAHMRSRPAGLLALMLAFGVAACGDRAQGSQPDRVAAADLEPKDPEPPKVDPCTLLTDEEISDQLWLSLQPSERKNYHPKGFNVTKNEVPWGVSRRCEFAYQSKAQISGGPILRGEFNVMVSDSSMANAVPERQKQPIAGVGDQAF